MVNSLFWCERGPGGPAFVDREVGALGEETLNYSELVALVIEDQPFVRRTIAHILKQIGFENISEAEEGESGLRECIRCAPDIIICDIDMKPVNGLEFLANMRASPEVANRRTPVVYLTNHTESDIVRKAMALGVNAFVVKPPSVAALKERIDRLLAPR